MTEAMTPISTDALHCRTLLMNQLLYLSTRLMRYECILLPYLEKLLTGLNRYGYMWIQFTQSVNQSHFNTKELVLMRYLHESMDIVSLEDTVRSQRVEDWVYHVQETLGGLISLPAEDIACRNRHWAV